MTGVDHDGPIKDPRRAHPTATGHPESSRPTVRANAAMLKSDEPVFALEVGVSGGLVVGRVKDGAVSGAKPYEPAGVRLGT